MNSIRLRDFIEDRDGCIYAVSNYDNDEKAGCILRYVPDENGERTGPDNTRYKKYDFEEAFEYIRLHKPEYLDVVHRVPVSDIRRVMKPDILIGDIAARDARVRSLLEIFAVPKNQVGCTGSLLCSLENETSDIDMVVYGDYWFTAQKNLIKAVKEGRASALSEDMWQKVYNKRIPEISYEIFVLHEKRKWNRGEIAGTYFDLLYTRSYDQQKTIPFGRGEVLGRKTIEATVTDDSLIFDSPAVYSVDHRDVTKVLSFTHTYSGQAIRGEVIEASGVLEQHGDEQWLIIGTTREAKGEYIVSKTLIEEN